ncbi:MAG: regulatory protein GemA [Sulfurovum sp.]|nr:regulatory protein GemA [Sulfurovum sp.]
MGMTAKQRAYHKALVQYVHLSKKYRAFYKDDREAYEEVLYNAFGKRSSKDLSVDQLVTLVDWMNGRTDTLPIYKPDMITEAQSELLRDLWRRYAKNKDDTALLGFVKRVGKRAYMRVELIDRQSATKAITALKKTLGEK